MITILTAIASGEKERQTEIIFMCYYLHYIPVSLYVVCTDVIKLVPSSEAVVMEL